MKKPAQKRRSLLFRSVRALGIAVLITFLVLAWAVFRQPTQGSMLLAQYRAMRDAHPPGTVAYFYDPAMAPIETILDEASRAEPPEPAGHDDHDDDGDCMRVAPHRIPTGGVGDPASLASLNRYMGFTLPDSRQTVFCHAMTSEAGITRLVVATIGPDLHARNLLPSPVMEVLFIDPAGLTGTPRVIGRQRIFLTDPCLLFLLTTFHFGQTEGVDTFLISYEYCGKIAQLRGKLLPDARHVLISQPQ